MSAHIRRYVRAAGAALLVGGVVACEDATAPGGTNVVAVADDVAMGVGDTLRLEASLRVGDRVVRDAPITWRSLDEARASVEPSSGLVTARDTGLARIVASSGAHADTVRLTITSAVASLTLVFSSDTGRVGGSVAATVVARDAAGNVIARPALLWSSSDSAVALPTGTGSVVTWDEGSSMIRVTAGTQSVEAPIHVRYDRLWLGALDVQQLSLGYDFGCLLDGAGRAHCFGRQAAGRLGRSGLTTSATYSATPVETDQRFVQIEAQGATACGRTAGNRLFCWGENAIPRNSPLPVPILDSLPTQDFSIGAHSATCALAVDGVLRCWGHNDFYQLGRGPLRGYDTLPAPVTGSELRFRDVAIGYLHGCGLLVDGRGVCWGGINDADYGAENVPRDPPAMLPGGPALTQIVSMGGVFLYDSCGLTAEGEAWCWGDNGAGLHGTGIMGTGTGRRMPQRVATDRRFVRLDAGFFHVCGLTADGEIWCWGETEQFGIPWSRYQGRPMRFAAAHRFVSFATSDLGTCGIKADGYMLCAGLFPRPAL